jgi:MFS transporter, ACS family, glucarate transporter
MSISGWITRIAFCAKRVLFVSALLGALASMATAIAPSVATGAIALVLLLLTTRLVLGIAQSPLYPVSSGALQAWFPPEQWALTMGLIVTSIGLGAAVTPPAIAWLMHAVGWRIGLCIATIPGVLSAVFWWVYAQDPGDRRDPLLHKASEGAASSTEVAAPKLLRAAIAPALNRDVLTLTVSYVLDNAAVYLITFWSFLYLVQDRHFTILEGGWLAGIPFIVGALGGVAGGRLCDRCCRRFGPRWGVRMIPLIVLPSAAVMLYMVVETPNPYAAVAALTACYTCLLMTEGSYWAATMRVARDQTMAAGGVLNTGGNVGGAIATPIVGYLSGLHNWTLCFTLGVAAIIGSAVLWLFVDPTRDRRPDGRLYHPVTATGQ